MQWGLIFGDASVNAAFMGLAREDQITVGAAYLYRQRRLLEQFDAVYGEKLSGIYFEGLLACVERNNLSIDLEGRIESSIPDTDEFAEQEGAYAQNILIALNYLLAFARDGGHDFFERSISMAMENIDLISYEADNSYDEAMVIQRERSVVLSMMDRLAKKRQGSSGLKLLAWMSGGDDL